jgi:ribonuclease P protein component
MLPKNKRIPRSLFSEILKSRHFTHSAHFSLRIGVSGEKTARAAVSVSKKVSKSAVVRNSIRRRTYSALAPHLPSLSTGLYLVVAKSGAEKLKGEALNKEIGALLKAGERS